MSGVTLPALAAGAPATLIDAAADAMERVAANMSQNDRLRPAFGAFALALRALGSGIADGQMTRDALATFRTELPRTVVIDPATIHQIGREAAAGADEHAAQLVRSHDWRTIVFGALATALLLASVAAGCWWVGRQETAAETATLAAETEHKTEAVKQEIRAVSNDLATAALKGGPQKARLWLELIQWNDIQAALGNRKDCSAPNGRQGCYLPFWIEALKASRP